MMFVIVNGGAPPTRPRLQDTARGRRIIALFRCYRARGVPLRDAFHWARFWS